MRRIMTVTQRLQPDGCRDQDKGRVSCIRVDSQLSTWTRTGQAGRDCRLPRRSVCADRCAGVRAGRWPQARAPTRTDDGERQDAERGDVTAQKRTENLQNVPISIQVLGTDKLEELNVTEFRRLREVPAERLLPERCGPGFAHDLHARRGQRRRRQPLRLAAERRRLPRRAADHHDRGALDIHIYDIARVEALAGPQGTLYGASSRSGHDPHHHQQARSQRFCGQLRAAGNDSVDHGGVGYTAEGMVNMPMSDQRRPCAWSAGTSTTPATSTTSSVRARSRPPASRSAMRMAARRRRPWCAPEPPRRTTTMSIPAADAWR